MQKTLALERLYLVNVDLGRTLGVRLNGSTLNLIIPAIAPGMPLSAITLYSKIDIEKSVVGKYEILSRLNAKKNTPIEAGAIVWFENGAFLPYITEKGGLLKSKKDYDTEWQKIEF